ncbi:MAG TPA: hypothetical protein VKD89_03480 [Candidatus Udaeobacter sp.]|nr:hypothetical protein [Candidatus Udaeobacter sp.]
MAVDILVEAVLVGVTSAVAISAVSAVVTLVVPASAASTQAAFAQLRTALAVRVLPVEVWVHQGALSDTTMEAATCLPRELTHRGVGRIDP